MTNKSYSAKKPRLRSVDLSFDDHAEGQPKEYGSRSHSGQNGSKKYPLSIHSFEKDGEYQKKLAEDIDRLFKEEILLVHGSPTWVEEVHKESTNSGESPLFLHRLLSPCKSAQSNQNKIKRAASANATRTITSETGLYYRPNRTHQYLSQTELRDQSLDDVNLKYGRPTRTTLLRARQRGNTPPVNAYEERKEQMKRADELKSSSILSSVKESYRNDGESLHSFLTGARYNGAHCVDIRSLSLYGIYMPRTDPTRYFINKASSFKESPSGPPDSPRSDRGVRMNTPFQRRPMTAPGYGKRMSTPTQRKPYQAWTDTDEMEELAIEDDSVDHNESTTNECRNTRKVAGMGSNRFSTGPGLPTVQGISVCKVGRQRLLRENFSPPVPVIEATPSKRVNVQDKEMVPNHPRDTKARPVLIDRSVKAPSVDTEGNLVYPNIVSEEIIEQENCDVILENQNCNETDPTTAAENDETLGVNCSTSVNNEPSECTLKTVNSSPDLSQVINIPSETGDEQFFITEKGSDTDRGDKQNSISPKEQSGITDVIKVTIDKS
ncbi:uncharacterized protein LOC126819338 isoform X1 [Patella vulgata]|uniref:uncharacterized protein LOC126819338 isoform X1 n=1 Tax=Patella vulgata TaxID=6465 RepID=UPI0021802EB6|nr:uncharacterized protein LOC126819338 isoform X1 [Patella vulgata]